jgi:hypothetical protein
VTSLPESTEPIVECNHERVVSHVCDQTLGVLCLDCNTILGCCWMDEHLPESLWNRVCIYDRDAKPCEQSRDDHCFLCGEKFELKSSSVS